MPCFIGVTRWSACRLRSPAGHVFVLRRHPDGGAGAVTQTEAQTLPSASKTGAPKQRSPSSVSPKSIAYPFRRTSPRMPDHGSALYPARGPSENSSFLFRIAGPSCAGRWERCLGTQAGASKFLRELLDRVGSESAFQQPLEKGGIVHSLDLFADSLRIAAVADFQGA